MCILCAVDGFKLFAEAHFINIAEIEDIMHNEKTKQHSYSSIKHLEDRKRERSVCECAWSLDY